MKKPITERQKQLLGVIYEFVKDTGYPPTFDEMRQMLGVSSNQTIIDHLLGLEKAKLIQRSEAAARGLRVLPMGYAVLGKPSLVGFAGMTSAGVPIEVMEISGEWREVGEGIEQNLRRMFVC